MGFSTSSSFIYIEGRISARIMEDVGLDELEREMGLGLAISPTAGGGGGGSGGIDATSVSGGNLNLPSSASSALSPTASSTTPAVVAAAPTVIESARPVNSAAATRGAVGMYGCLPIHWICGIFAGSTPPAQTCSIWYIYTYYYRY